MSTFIKQKKDLKKRTLYAKFELHRLEFLALTKDSQLTKKTKIKSFKQLNDLPRNSSLSRVRNRCLLTGRGNSVYRFCRLSRIKIRELASSGWLTGLHKSSW